MRKLKKDFPPDPSPETRPRPKSWLLPIKERDILSKAAPKDEIFCPECGEKAIRSKSNNKWRCVAAQDIQTGPTSKISVLTCGARGTTLGEDLVTTEALFRREA